MFTSLKVLHMSVVLALLAAPLSRAVLLFSRAVENKNKPVFVDYTKVAIFSVGHAVDSMSFQNIITGYKLAQKVNTGIDGTVDYFIAGNFPSAQSKILAESNIKELKLPLEGATDTNLGTLNGLPSRHWWSYIPEELVKQGYGLSMYFNASEVVAMNPMSIDDAKKSLKRGNSAIAISTMDWTSFSNPGTLIHSGLVWFNNSKAKEEKLFKQYKSFVQRNANNDEEDYLKEFVTSPQVVGFKAAALNPQWQMVCKKSTMEMKEHYSKGNMPYFVHLGNCRGRENIPPAKMQLGLPAQATQKWNDQFSEVLDIINI